MHHSRDSNLIVPGGAPGTVSSYMSSADVNVQTGLRITALGVPGGSVS